MVLRMKKFNILSDSQKNPTFREMSTKEQYREGDCLKGRLGQFVDLRGAWQEREGW